MKLEIDTIISLLATIADSPDRGITIVDKIYSIDPKKINYHLLLMIEGGLIHGWDMSSGSELSVLVDRLTWKGHCFLTHAQNETVWNRFKRLEKEVGEISFDLICTALSRIAEHVIKDGIHTKEMIQ